MRLAQLFIGLLILRLAPADGGILVSRELLYFTIKCTNLDLCVSRLRLVKRSEILKTCKFAMCKTKHLITRLLVHMYVYIIQVTLKTLAVLSIQQAETNSRAYGYISVWTAILYRRASV